MTDIRQQIESWVRSAAQSALGEAGDTDPLLRPSKDPKFGDYQVNLAMSLGKKLGTKPRQLGEQLAEAFRSHESAGHFEAIEVAGPGFINLTLSQAYVDQATRTMFDDPRLGVADKSQPETVVVDYSSPNLAKEMHIGHLRSSIIGDAICRVLTLTGDRVIRQNHLGDWGTQFGMLLEHLIDTGWDESADHSIGDLNQLYRDAKQRFDDDTDFADRCRRRVVGLQAGEEQAIRLWRQLIDESVSHMNSVYSLLGVLLDDDDIRPESFYNSELPRVVTDLRAAGDLVEDDGAQVVFNDGFKNKDGDPLPLIVQKSDGGFGYAATDLAAVRFRVDQLKASRIVYVVDARQSDHFALVFSTLRKAGWASADTQLEHVAFGTILGKDKKPFKTREGGTVRLVDVLSEAKDRALKVIAEKNPDLPVEEQTRIAHAVGVGAVKYADLSSERIKDYVFDWQRMLALEGNTSPYLQNAYVRICSILRKGEVNPGALASSAIEIKEPAERALAMELLQFPQTIAGVARSLEPHRLCNYLYAVASRYHTFYEKCRVLNAPAEVRDSRLALSYLVARTLKTGLGLLGIDAIERM